MPHDVSTDTVLQGWHPSEMTTWRPKLKMQGYLGVLNRAVPVFLFRAVPEKMTLMCFICQLLHLSWKIKLFHLVTGIHQRCFFFSRPFTGPLSFFAGCIMIASIVLGLGFFLAPKHPKKRWNVASSQKSSPPLRWYAMVCSWKTEQLESHKVGRLVASTKCLFWTPLVLRFKSVQCLVKWSVISGVVHVVQDCTSAIMHESRLTFRI